MDPLKLEHQLCFPIYAAANAITRAYRPLLDELGLTYPQYLVMMVLWEHDGVSLNDVGHKLHLDSGTLTPLLKRMETQGYIARARSKEDERRIVITLTPAGKKLKQAAAKVPLKLAAKTQMTLQQMGVLRQQLNDLVASLDDPTDKP